jgi:uncharacterized protein
MRVVFDTNVLVSYLLTHRPPIATLIDRHLAEERFVLLTAPELLQELDLVLRYPKLARHCGEEERARFVALVRALAEVVELPEAIPRICRDKADDAIIACAVVGRAGAIVSGDADLLALERVGGIEMLSAARFLERLEGD